MSGKLHAVATLQECLVCGVNGLSFQLKMHEVKIPLANRNPLEHSKFYNTAKEFQELKRV
jgi:hypothetical protein